MLFLNLLNIVFPILSFVSISHADTYSNPIRAVQGSDPFVVYTGGYYYLLTTTWVDVEITRATTLEGLKTATPKVVCHPLTRPSAAMSGPLKYITLTILGMFYTPEIEKTPNMTQDIGIFTSRLEPTSILMGKRFTF
jgi:GH43 family beta-xylosidase